MIICWVVFCSSGSSGCVWLSLVACVFLWLVLLNLTSTHTNNVRLSA